MATIKVCDVCGKTIEGTMYYKVSPARWTCTDNEGRKFEDEDHEICADCVKDKLGFEMKKQKAEFFSF